MPLLLDACANHNYQAQYVYPICAEFLSQSDVGNAAIRYAGDVLLLGYNVSATTIRHILEVNGIVPDPERRLRGDWSQFIETQQYVTAATDFAQVERLTPFGLVRESLLFFMDIGSREVCLGGIVHNPDSNWTTQIARNMCDMWDGFMLGKKYLIHDRDPLFNKRFQCRPIIL